jgi:hypothetical protein
VRSCWLLGGGGAAGDIGERGHAQAHRAAAAGDEAVDLGELVVRGGEADLQSLGFAGPALVLGFVDAGGQVVADIRQTGPLIWGNPEEGTSDAPLTDLTPMFPQFMAGFRRGR